MNLNELDKKYKEVFNISPTIPTIQTPEYIEEPRKLFGFIPFGTEKVEVPKKSSVDLAPTPTPYIPTPVTERPPVSLWEITKQLPGAIMDVLGLTKAVEEIKDPPEAWKETPFGVRMRYYSESYWEEIGKVLTGIPKAAIQFIATPTIGVMEEAMDVEIGEVELPTKIGEWIGPLTGTRTQRLELEKQGYSPAEAGTLVVAQQMGKSLPFVITFGIPAFVDYLLHKPTVEQVLRPQFNKVISIKANQVAKTAKLPKPTAYTAIRTQGGVYEQIVRIKGMPDRYLTIHTEPITGIKTIQGWDLTNPAIQIPTSAILKGAPEISMAQIPKGITFIKANPLFSGVNSAIKTIPIEKAHTLFVQEAAKRVAPIILKKPPIIPPIVTELVKPFKKIEPKPLVPEVKPEAVVPEPKPTPKIISEAVKAPPKAIIPEKRVIPKELEPLAQEAKKYKSAEEFVEKENIYLHGTGIKQASIIESEGFKLEQLRRTDVRVPGESEFISLTRKPAEAEVFATKDGTIFVTKIKSKIKIASQEQFESLNQELGRNWSLTYKELRKRGFDAVDFTDAFSQELRILNPEVIESFTNLKGSLKDFYTQATKPVKEVKPEVVKPEVKVLEVKPEKKLITKPSKIEYLHLGIGGLEPYSPQEILRIEKELSKAEAEKAPDELPTTEEQEVIKRAREYKAGTKLKMAVRMLAEQKHINPKQYTEIVEFLTGRESLSAKGGATIDDARKVMAFIRELVSIRPGGKVYIPVGDHMLPLEFFNQVAKGKPSDFVSDAIDPEFHALYKMGAGHIYEMMNEANLSKMIDIKTTLDDFKEVLKPASKEGIEKNIFLALNGKKVPLTSADKEAVDFIKKWEDKDLRMKNAVRGKTGMPLIKPVKEYIYRMYVESVREAQKEKYTIDAGVLQGMDRYLPKQVWTPTFLRRKLTFDQALEKGLETNILKTLQRQVDADLRFIHLTGPIRKIKTILPYYDYASQKHIRTWISEAFLKRPTEMDKKVNQFIENRTQGKLEIIDKALKKVGGSKSSIKALKNIALRPFYDILFFANFTLGNRNLTQGILDFGLIPPQDIMWGYESLFTKQGRAILSHSKMFKTRMAYEWYGQNFTTTNLSNMKNTIIRAGKAIERSGSFYFRFIDKYPNVGGMILGSFHFFTKKGYDPVESMFLAERNAKITQFSYLGWDMPRPFRSATLSPIYMLKSWPLYFKNYIGELLNRLWTGKDMGGRSVSGYERLGIFAYIAALALVFYAAKKTEKKIGISIWRSILPWQVFGGAITLNPFVKTLYGLGQIVTGYTTGYSPLVEQGKKNIFKPIPPGARRIYTFYEVSQTGKTDKERMTKWEAFLRIFFVTTQQVNRQKIYNKIGKISNRYLSVRENYLKQEIPREKRIEKIKEYNKWAIEELESIAEMSDYPLSSSLRKKYTVDADDLRRWAKGEKEDKTSMEELLKIK